MLGVFAEKDARVNAGKDKLDAALTAAGLTHEMARCSPVWTTPSSTTPGRATTQPAAAEVYQRMLDWFGTHLT